MTGYQRRDQECSAGHCGVSSRSRAALPKSHEWNTSIGRSGGTHSSSQRTCGIGIHHHMVPCRMCGETPKKIKCWERSGCPVVRRDHALALITEIERMDTEKRNDRRFTREEANKVSTKISRFKKEPATC